MKPEDVDLLVKLTAARPNTIWASQGQNSYLTQMHIEHTLILIEEGIKTIQTR